MTGRLARITGGEVDDRVRPDTYRQRADRFAALIDATPAERWSSPSSCEGWTARDVVEHIVDNSAIVLRREAGIVITGDLDWSAAVAHGR